ncbi:MAG: hypothetical protein A3B23_03670 [Candidatus Colwellbacteria bacterium RIFCSPLOWO2_01_FULL_48_10]|uniref:Chaperone protein DnaJ n=1 Tax=Candidatus Colwellbacteria bacterium RIFCSPLOWO2_01_FULL_48_10 TaxID=1797690 RepID=A0A1G1Z4E9_9BACT|nr:MAG: hypothetical protein A3B23_03670 [Candidatus Colwellbacteria bacterium RIFCSPLOWO2_01_FULL_48_10]
MEDYYKILGVNREASADEVKKAFHKLAHKYHPDKSGGDEKKFKEVNEAYQALSNPEKRKQYDRFGKAGFNGGGFGAGSGFGGFQGDPSQWNVNFDGESGNFGDFKDIFDMFFDGGMGGRGRRKTYKRGGDLEMAAEITLDEAKRGKAIETSFDTVVQCKECKGIGHDAKEGFGPCAHCGGRGETREERSTFFGNFSQVVTCKKCHGRGQIPNKICARCSGVGRVNGKQSIKFDIRPGVEDGQIIKVRGMGEAGEHGLEAGDLYVRVRVKPHQAFTRQGNDLLVSVPATIVDVLLGRKMTLKGLDGKPVSFHIPAGHGLGHEIRVKGEGMTSGGDLVVKLDIKSPKHLNAKARKLIEDLEKEI